jgi:hypothetical protein
VCAVDYYRSGFSAEQIDEHTQNGQYLIAAVTKAFIDGHCDRTLDTKLKFHDLEHDADTIRNYGNFRIINELSKEVEHQAPKHTPHNNQNVEMQMLKKVMFFLACKMC